MNITMPNDCDVRHNIAEVLIELKNTYPNIHFLIENGEEIPEEFLESCSRIVVVVDTEEHIKKLDELGLITSFQEGQETIGERLENFVEEFFFDMLKEASEWKRVWYEKSCLRKSVFQMQHTISRSYPIFKRNKSPP